MPYAVVGLFGLAFGSFLNVCIFRLPRHESVITPRSRCPRCSQPIRWHDNIPVLSFLVLRGKCRNCRGPISPIYPVVELLAAGVLLLAFFQYPHPPRRDAAWNQPGTVAELYCAGGPAAARLDFSTFGFFLGLSASIVSGGFCRSRGGRRVVLRRRRNLLPLDGKGRARLRRRHVDADGRHVPRRSARAADDSGGVAAGNGSRIALRAAELPVSSSSLALRKFPGGCGALREPGRQCAARHIPPMVGARRLI
ncbi:MAG: prepilin peptidase [Acidobacteria bacterium]|nr:prepilin peptidase [Acidobacteriota bacterium]